MIRIPLAVVPVRVFPCWLPGNVIRELIIGKGRLSKTQESTVGVLVPTRYNPVVFVLEKVEFLMVGETDAI